MEKTSSTNGWIMTVNPIKSILSWSTEYVDIPMLTNYTSIPSDVQSSCTNTTTITNYGNSSTYPAAWAAKNYKPTGTPSGKSWCLPSGGLLNSALNNSTNFAKINTGITNTGGTRLGNISSGYEVVWSSSEHSTNNAWHFYTWTNGSFGMYYASKGNYNNDLSVRPVLEF